MTSCGCTLASHPCRLVVITGGPGAGKTAVLEVARTAFCQHVQVLPEAAGIGLPEAVRMVTATPAKAAHLSDRGEIASGRRGDLVRVRMHGDMPVVKGVWRQGQRVS